MRALSCQGKTTLEGMKKTKKSLLKVITIRETDFRGHSSSETKDGSVCNRSVSSWERAECAGRRLAGVLGHLFVDSNWHPWKLGSYLPTGPGRRGPLFLDDLAFSGMAPTSWKKTSLSG